MFTSFCWLSIKFCNFQNHLEQYYGFHGCITYWGISHGLRNWKVFYVKHWSKVVMLPIHWFVENFTTNPYSIISCLYSLKTELCFFVDEELLGKTVCSVESDQIAKRYTKNYFLQYYYGQYMVNTILSFYGIMKHCCYKPFHECCVTLHLVIANASNEQPYGRWGEEGGVT